MNVVDYVHDQLVSVLGLKPHPDWDQNRLREKRAAQIPENSFFEFPGAKFASTLSVGLVFFP